MCLKRPTPASCAVCLINPYQRSRISDFPKELPGHKKVPDSPAATYSAPLVAGLPTENLKERVLKSEGYKMNGCQSKICIKWHGLNHFNPKNFVADFRSSWKKAQYCFLKRGELRCRLEVFQKIHPFLRTQASLLADYPY